MDDKSYLIVFVSYSIVACFLSLYFGKFDIWTHVIFFSSLTITYILRNFLFKKNE